jgi:hypothetical protein
MKLWILILTPTFLLITAPDIQAHNLVTVNGNTQDHQHVYRRQAYGKPLQQGHLYQAPGGSSTILWGSDARPEYGKSTARRSGPVIDDKKLKPGAIPNVSSKYGSAVNRYGKPVRGYGKPVPGYGKPVTGYGKPDRDN